MSKINFNKLNLKNVKQDYREITITEDVSLQVLQYLPQTQKVEFIQFVVENSIDPTNNTFSPIRIETYYGLAIMKYYTNINFTDKQLENAPKTYDLLESNGILDEVINLIPSSEYDFMRTAIESTCEDISKFSNSFVGVLSSMNQDASSLEAHLNTMLSEINEGKGLEKLSAIKDIVG